MTMHNRIERTCFNCRHWRPQNEAETEGDCHGVRPGAAWSDAANRAVTFWPRTNTDDHCPSWAQERRPENRRGPLGEKEKTND